MKGNSKQIETDRLQRRQFAALYRGNRVTVNNRITVSKAEDRFLTGFKYGNHRLK